MWKMKPVTQMTTIWLWMMTWSDFPLLAPAASHIDCHTLGFTWSLLSSLLLSPLICNSVKFDASSLYFFLFYYQLSCTACPIPGQRGREKVVWLGHQLAMPMPAHPSSWIHTLHILSSVTALSLCGSVSIRFAHVDPAILLYSSLQNCSTSVRLWTILFKYSKTFLVDWGLDFDSVTVEHSPCCPSTISVQLSLYASGFCLTVK